MLAVKVPKRLRHPGFGEQPGKPRGLVARGNDRLAVDDRDAMREAIALQVGVDQRGHHADLGEPEPYRRKIGAVLQHQRDGITARETLRERPVGDAIGACVEGGVGHALPFEDDRGFRAIAVNAALDLVDDRHRRIGLQLLQRLHDAVDILDEGGLPPDRADGFQHGCLSPRWQLFAAYA